MLFSRFYFSHHITKHNEKKNSSELSEILSVINKSVYKNICSFSRKNISQPKPRRNKLCLSDVIKNSANFRFLNTIRSNVQKLL